ncbi:restriction endonuclease subunit S [Weissella fabalis]|uniref:Restriction endonuclease subunit S n=1 Tax=Periweissella fabalis TaxID=1070421 RepID=A0A7X6N082_9LACO|nr:restriction endonuclease subunit S [Periweissella fabalis]NKZ23396.1 restriction endonuclease subunit S [Periweissella fabalis]
MISISSGKRPPIKEDFQSKEYPIPIIGASKVMGWTNEELLNESILTIGRVGTHGIVQRFRIPVWVSDNSFVIKADYEEVVNQILRYKIDWSSLNRGSTQPLITQNDLKNVLVSLPNSNELKQYNSIAARITDFQFNIIKQVGSLEKLRDTLINKLI